MGDALKAMGTAPTPSGTALKFRETLTGVGEALTDAEEQDFQL
jgi:hypothetical protein